jgi:hypothetical protein
VPALLVDRNRNSTSRRDQYRKVGLQEAIPRLASIVDDGQLLPNPAKEGLPTTRKLARPLNTSALCQGHIRRSESYPKSQLPLRPSDRLNAQC